MNGFGGQQVEVAQHRGVDLPRRRRGGDGPTLAQDPLRLRHRSEHRFERWRGFGLLHHPGQAVLDRLQVGQDELGVDGLDVAGRVDPGVDVDHVVVVEGAHHLAHGVALPDGGEELIAQTLPVRRAADDAGDVDERHRRRHHRRPVVERGQRLEPWVGHGHHADVRLDGGEGVIGRQDVVVRERVEERRLPDVRQTDDPDRQRHGR